MAETVGWLAIGVPPALIALGLAMAFVAEHLAGLDREDLAFAGMLVAMAGFALIAPGILLGLVLGLVGRGGRGEAVTASWDILASDGSVHAVTLPAFRIRPPDHAWVDGRRIPLVWREEDIGRSVARVTCDELMGDLRLWADGAAFAHTLGAATLRGADAEPALRASLEVDDAIVRVVEVVGGRRAA